MDDKIEEGLLVCHQRQKPVFFFFPWYFLFLTLAQLEGLGRGGLAVSCHHLYYRTIICFAPTRVTLPISKVLRHGPLRRRSKTNCRILIRCALTLALLKLSLSRTHTRTLCLSPFYPAHGGLIGFRPLTSFKNRARSDPQLFHST